MRARTADQRKRSGIWPASSSWLRSAPLPSTNRTLVAIFAPYCDTPYKLTMLGVRRWFQTTHKWRCQSKYCPAYQHLISIIQSNFVWNRFTALYKFNTWHYSGICTLNCTLLACSRNEYSVYNNIRNAETACYGFEKNAECRLRCGLQLLTFLGMQSLITIVVTNYVFITSDTAIFRKFCEIKLPFELDYLSTIFNFPNPHLLDKT